MTTETPRTDAMISEFPCERVALTPERAFVDAYTLAKALERELAAMTAERDRLWAEISRKPNTEIELKLPIEATD